MLRCVWANGVLLFDTETLADHIPKDDSPLKLEVKLHICEPLVDITMKI
jgi:hypothetical protein